MSILVRNESFGYIAFDNITRKHVFVETDKKIAQPLTDEAVSEIYNKLLVKDKIYIVGTYEKSNSPKGLVAPMCLYLEITSWCPLDCAHCYKPSEKHEEKKLKLEDYTDIIIQAHEMGVFEVRLCGNEPVLSPYFAEICILIKKLNMHLSINTSGRLDSKYRALLISQNPDCVVVSLDGIKEVHDKVRAEGAYNLSLSLLDDLKKNNIVKRINCVLSKETMPFIENVVQEAHLAKCGISFIPLRTMGKETEYKKSAALSKKEMLSCVEQITKLRLQYEDVPIETFFDILGGTFTAHHMMNFNSPCPAGKNGFVAADGTFFPCDWIRYLGDRFNCGSVIDQGLKNIW